MLSIVETMLGDAPSRRLLTDQAWAPSVLDADQFILKVGDKDIKPLRGLPAASGSVRRAAPATSQAESAFALYDFKGRLDILAAARKRVKELAATGDLPVDSVGWRRLLRGVQGAPLSKEGDKRLLAAFRKPRGLSPEDSAKYDAAIDAIQKELDALITPGYAKDDAAPARIAEQAKRSLAAFRSLVDPEQVNRATLAAVRRQKAKNVLANRDRAKFIADADDVSRRGRLFGDVDVPAEMVEPASLENYGDGTSKVTDLKVAKLKDGTWAILRGGPDDTGVQGEEVLASLAASDEAALAEAIAENTDPQDVLDALAPAQIQRLVASETAEEVLESALTPDAFMDTIRYAYDAIVDMFDGVGATPERVAKANEAITRRLLVDAPDVLRLWEPGNSIFTALVRAKYEGVDPAQIDAASILPAYPLSSLGVVSVNSTNFSTFEGLTVDALREGGIIALRAAVRIVEKFVEGSIDTKTAANALSWSHMSIPDIKDGVARYLKGVHPNFSRVAWARHADLPLPVFDAIQRGDDSLVDAFVDAAQDARKALSEIDREFRKVRSKVEHNEWLASLRKKIYAMEQEIEAKRLDLSKAPEPKKPAEPGAARTSTPVGTSAEAEDARKIAANALARVAIKSESTWLDRAKAGKRGRKRILEVIRAARDKQGRARNRLGSNVALITDNDYDIAKHFIASIGTKRLEQVALAIEPAVRLRNGIFDNEPLGVNYMASQVIGISHLAISTGRFTSTVIHELWHTLSQFIPKDTLADMYRQFVMERAAFAVANPGAFDAAGRLRVINYVEGQSTYRYASFDEWVVEKMTDLSITDAVGKISTKRIREQGTKVFMSPGMQALRALRALAESTYHQVETVHGADAVREAFLDFQSGLFLERLRDTSLAAISEVNEAERALQAKWTAFIADLATGKPPEVAREDFVGATRDFLNSMAWRSPDRITGAEDTIDGGLDALEEIQSAAAIIPPQFVSRLEAALETFPGKRATIDQIEAYRKKSKVKDVELEMAGFQAFKDDLAARGVKSVTLDEARQSLKAAQDRFRVEGAHDSGTALTEEMERLEQDVGEAELVIVYAKFALQERLGERVRPIPASTIQNTDARVVAALTEEVDGNRLLKAGEDFIQALARLSEEELDALRASWLRQWVMFEADAHDSIIYAATSGDRAGLERAREVLRLDTDTLGALIDTKEVELSGLLPQLEHVKDMLNERQVLWSRWSIDGGSDYAEIRVIDKAQEPELTAPRRYHFEQTAAVHTRVKTRDSSEGPVLGMDEMQSDHYQAKPVGAAPPEGEPDNRPKVAGEGVFAGDRWKYAGIRAAVIEAARRGLNGVAAPDGALAANAVGATLEKDPKAHQALVAFYDVQVPRLMKDVARDLGLAVREIDVPDYGRKVTAIMFDGKAVQGVPLFAKGAKKADVPAIKPPPEIVPVVPLPVNRPGSYVNVQFASPVDAAVYLWVLKVDNPAAQRALAAFYKAVTGRDLDVGEVSAHISKITAAAKAEVDALKTLSKSADKPTIVKVKPLIDYIEGTVFDGWKLASKERLALEGAGPALLALKDRLAANLTADQVVAKVNGYRDAAVKAFRNDKQGKRSIFIVGDTPEEIDAIAAAVDERLAIGGLTLKAQYTNPTNKTYFVTERIQPGAIEVAPPAAKPAPAAKVQHPKLSKELASAPLNVRGKRVSFASDLDRAAFVVTRAKTPEDAAEYLKFVSNATGMDEAAVRAHGAKVAKAISDQAAKAKESTAFTLARVYDGAVVDTKAAATPTPAAVVDDVDAPTVIAPARPTAPPPAAPPAAPAPAAPTPSTPTAAPRKPYQLVARIGVNQDGDVDVAEIFGKADLTDLRALYNRLTSVGAGKGDVDAADVPFDIAGDLAANERAAKALFAPISARASSPPTSDEASVGKAIEALDAFFAGVSDLHAQARQYRAARGEKEALAEIDEVIDATLMAAEIRGLAAYRAAAALRAGAATPLYGDVPEVRAVTQAVIDRPGFATKLREVVNKAAGGVIPNAPIARVAYGEGSSVPLIVDTASTQRLRALSRPMSGEVDKTIAEKVKIAADAEPNEHTVLIRFQGEDVHYTPEKFEEILDRAVSEYAAAEQAARAAGKTGLNLNVRLARANRDFGVALVERRAVEIPEAVISEDDEAIAAALAGGRHTWKPHEVAIDRMFNDTNGDVPPPGHGFVHAPVPVFRSRVLEPKAIPSIRSDLSSNEAIDVESVFPRATPRRRGAAISTRSFTEAVDQALAAPFLQDGGGPGALRTVLRKMVLPFIGEASALPFLRAPASLRPFMATLANEVEQGIGDMVVMLRQAPSGDLIFRYLSGEPGLVTPFGIPVASAGRINAAENARATMTRLYEAFLSGGENSPGAQVVKGFTYTGTELPVTQADLLAGAVAAARAARKSGDKFNVVGWINSTFDLPRDPKGAPLDKDAIGAATTAINNAISAITGARVISAGKAAAAGDQAVADIAPDFLRDMRKILLSQGETALGRTPPTDLPLIDLLTDPDPDYNDPEQVRALVNSLVSIIATSTLDDLAINRRAVNLVVHMAAYAQATHGLVRLSRTGVAITPDQFNLITRALNSEYLEEAERAEAERLVRVFGMVEGSDMERIDITGEDIYVPRSVAQILAQAFSKAKPIELAAFGRGKDALAARGELIARSASTAVVRGNILLKNSKMVQDTVDGFFRVMTMTDPSVTARYTARTASAAIYGLIPGLAPMIQIARQKGQELDVVGRLADGGQAAATAINRYVGALSDAERAAFHAKVEDMLKLGMQRPSVLAVWRGDNVVVPTAIGQTTARELRDVMQQHGVLSSFDTSQRVEASLRDLFGMTYAEAQKNPTAAVQNMIGRIKGLSPHIAKELLRSPLDALQWTREVTSSTMEQFSSMERISLAVTLLEDGFDPVSAARSTSAILYNYGRTIHGADRSLFVALFLPFWAWRKNNNRAVLDLMFSQQGRVALMRARRAQAGIFGSAQSIIDAYTADEYGIDTEQMTPTQREMYYGMVGALEREYGYPLPVEQVAALRAVVSNQVGTTLQVGGEQYLTSGSPSTGFTQLAAKFLKAGAGGNPMLAAPGRANERYLRNVRGRAQVRMLQVDPNTASPQQIAAMIMQETETAAMIATAVNVLGVIGMVATGLINEGTTVIGKLTGASDMPYAIAPSELPFTAADAEMSPLYGQILAAWQGLTSPETDGMTRVPDEIGYLLASMGGDLVTIRRQPVATEDPNNQVEMKESYYVSTATWSAINLISIFALQDAKREFEQAAQAYKVAMEANDKDAAATAFETMITLLGYRIRRGADERIGTEGMDANSARRE